jgi:hypothetical protein
MNANEREWSLRLTTGELASVPGGTNDGKLSADNPSAFFVFAFFAANQPVGAG